MVKVDRQEEGHESRAWLWLAAGASSHAMDWGLLNTLSFLVGSPHIPPSIFRLFFLADSDVMHSGIWLSREAGSSFFTIS
jgi:hypothetical protein